MAVYLRVKHEDRMRIFLLLIIVLFYSGTEAQLITTRVRLYSKEVQDSFVITVSHAGELDSHRNYSTVYYLDADLKSGKALRMLAGDPGRHEKLASILFIGISGVGNYHETRRRDFISPLWNKETEAAQPMYGHADRFYAFLTRELIPEINRRYPVNEQRSLIGHSFGGLFVLYALLREERPFRQYIALSPSLWTNHDDLFNYEEEYHRGHAGLTASLYLSAGTAEGFNHVLKTVRRMHRLLLERSYKGLRLIYAEHKGKTHNSQVPVSLAYVLDHVL